MGKVVETPFLRFWRALESEWLRDYTTGATKSPRPTHGEARRAWREMTEEGRALYARYCQ